MLAGLLLARRLPALPALGAELAVQQTGKIVTITIMASGGEGACTIASLRRCALVAVGAVTASHLFSCGAGQPAPASGSKAKKGKKLHITEFLKPEGSKSNRWADDDLDDSNCTPAACCAATELWVCPAVGIAGLTTFRCRLQWMGWRRSQRHLARDLRTLLAACLGRQCRPGRCPATRPSRSTSATSLSRPMPRPWPLSSTRSCRCGHVCYVLTPAS